MFGFFLSDNFPGSTRYFFLVFFPLTSFNSVCGLHVRASRHRLPRSLSLVPVFLVVSPTGTWMSRVPCHALISSVKVIVFPYGF